MPQVVKKQYVSRNGEWVEVATGGGGGGTDEVVIAAAAPADPATEVWIDSTVVARSVRSVAGGNPLVARIASLEAAIAELRETIAAMRN